MAKTFIGQLLQVYVTEPFPCFTPQTPLQSCPFLLPIQGTLRLSDAEYRPSRLFGTTSKATPQSSHSYTSTSSEWSSELLASLSGRSVEVESAVDSDDSGSETCEVTFEDSPLEPSTASSAIITRADTAGTGIGSVDDEGHHESGLVKDLAYVPPSPVTSNGTRSPGRPREKGNHWGRWPRAKL